MPYNTAQKRATCKSVLPEKVYVSVGLKADFAIFPDSPQCELPDLLREECSAFMPARFIFYFALAVDSFPRITVTDAFGRLNNVPVAAVIVDRAGGPSGSAIPPLIFECH